MTPTVGLVSLAPALPQVSRFDELRATVLNGVVSVHSKRNYAKALHELQIFCKQQQRPLSRPASAGVLGDGA